MKKFILSKNVHLNNVLIKFCSVRSSLWFYSRYLLSEVNSLRSLETDLRLVGTTEYQSLEILNQTYTEIKNLLETLKVQHNISWLNTKQNTRNSVY